MVQFFRFFFGFWSILFLISAYLQWNDPDPEVWISIYVFAAIMSALAAFERYFIPVLITTAMAGLLGGLYFFPASVGDWIQQEWQQADLSMKTLSMEEARESFALLFISIVMGLAAYTGWRKKVLRKDRG
jgi:ABC-type enterochelin transport system permease subunit